MIVHCFQVCDKKEHNIISRVISSNTAPMYTETPNITTYIETPYIIMYIETPYITIYIETSCICPVFSFIFTFCPLLRQHQLADKYFLLMFIKTSSFLLVGIGRSVLS